MGLTGRLDWPDGFRRLVEDRRRKGFSAIQIVAGPLPAFCATTDTWKPEQVNEAGAQYSAFYVNPRTGQKIEMGEVRPRSGGAWTPPPKPTMADWLLVLETT